jgi:hypothetical protein
MKSIIFWDITPCSPLKVGRRFGGTYRLHLRGRRVSRSRYQREIKGQAEANVCVVHESEWTRFPVACTEISMDQGCKSVLRQRKL